MTEEHTEPIDMAEEIVKSIMNNAGEDTTKYLVKIHELCNRVIEDSICMCNLWMIKDTVDIQKSIISSIVGRVFNDPSKNLCDDRLALLRV